MSSLEWGEGSVFVKDLVIQERGPQFKTPEPMQKARHGDLLLSSHSWGGRDRQYLETTGRPALPT